METGRAGAPSRDVVRCADILGSFGVTPADVRAQRREYHTTAPPGRAGGDTSLEQIIADVLADERDRTATVRQLICHGDRGIACSARYAQRALGRELEAVFASIGWSLEWTRTGPAETGRDRLELAATDPKERTREATVTYPQTPLADDNLPAVLRAVDDRLLAGTGATVVLLSAGVDRWRAAVIETKELERLRERYGQQISAFDRPLLPEHDLEAYVPADDDLGGGDDDGDVGVDDPNGAYESGPWPVWALERAKRRPSLLDGGSDVAPRETDDTQSSVASLIEEAESKGNETAANEGDETAGAPSTQSPSIETDGFEIRGGSPTVSRVSDDDSSPEPSPKDVADAMLEDQRERTAERRDGRDKRDKRERADEGDESSDDGFGTLSGSSKTARVGNDSFGTDDEFETAHDRYSALGVALGAGGAVSVEGLLEDDEFLPELPAAEPEETRIEFAESFDPDAVTTAKAAGEQAGFEWVDSGSLETTRVSNG
ncbi:hypothetical protein [Natronorubrum texcoconense]|uniref:Uncharacterized protein n=1 Tax=Natronorubrum texcoconense TaxID=1095776 RepID=A0A1G9GKT3_9EURY|nr:hypothetical protein [Natronorubrum texcoconense]SDL01267.1 hypothetical protein SAMN04515672_4547 [Natronorubrum texcoconense]